MNICDRTIHAARFIIKDSQSRDLFDQIFRILLRVIARNSQKNDETVADLADDFMINCH